MRTSARVAEVLPDGVRLADGEMIPAELVVWAAGVKAPDFLKDLDGLETNRINQLVVLPDAADDARRRHLRHRRLRRLPLARQGRRARAAARAGRAPAGVAHGEADRATGCAGKPLRPWRYRDFGSLVSLGEYSTVGNLMGGLIGGNLWIEGWFARMMYLSLYKMHELALHGFWKMALDTAATS